MQAVLFGIFLDAVRTCAFCIPQEIQTCPLKAEGVTNNTASLILMRVHWNSWMFTRTHFLPHNHHTEEGRRREVTGDGRSASSLCPVQLPHFLNCLFQSFSRMKCVQDLKGGGIAQVLYKYHNNSYFNSPGLQDRLMNMHAKKIGKQNKKTSLMPTLL